MTLNRNIIKAANILPTDNKKIALEKLGLKPTSANIDTAGKALDFVRNPEKYDLEFSADLMRKVIKEYKCVGFWFVTCVPYAKYAKLVFISKEKMLNYCGDFLRPSYVKDGEKQKRDEAGKPCFRFSAEKLRNLQGVYAGEEYTLDLQGMTFKAFCDKYRAEALRQNMGCFFETMTAKQLKMVQIGELDKLSHTHHTDLKDGDGNQYEVKMESGYITSQFWSGLYKWKS